MAIAQQTIEFIIVHVRYFVKGGEVGGRNLLKVGILKDGYSRCVCYLILIMWLIPAGICLVWGFNVKNIDSTASLSSFFRLTLILLQTIIDQMLVFLCAFVRDSAAAQL